MDGDCLFLATELSTKIKDSKVVIGHFNQNGYYVEESGEYHAWVEYDVDHETYIADPTTRYHGKKKNSNYVEFEDFEEFGMIIEPNIYSYMRRKKEKFFFTKITNKVKVRKEFDTLEDALEFKHNHFKANDIKSEASGTLTVSRMKELVVYVPETGDFISKVNGYGKVKGESCVKTSSDGYKHFSLDNNKNHAHVFAWFYMTGTMPDFVIDHKDGDPGNNRWDNLVKSNHSLNGFNTLNRDNNTSGIKGVVLNRTKSSWVAQIKINCKPVYLGSFSDFDDAVKARYDAEVKFDLPMDRSPSYLYLKEKGLI